jgi:hypothetical protein
VGCTTARSAADWRTPASREAGDFHCIGKLFFGIIGIETEYITFTRGSIAAVKMINRPLFFERFSASVRHEDVVGGSTLVYKLQFLARPRVLRGILNPVMRIILRRGTQKRLQSLSSFLEA